VATELDTALLRAVLEQYAVPDPSIVGTINRSGINLAYVSHAEITRILIEIDPNWSWEPIEWQNGRPAVHTINDMATMWGKLTLLGKSMIGCGTAKSNKPDLDKELIGDFLRNAAMRFGISLSLWSKQEWDAPQGNVVNLPVRTPEELASSRAEHPSAQSIAKVVSQLEDAFGGELVESRPANVRPIRSGGDATDKQKGLITKLSKEVIKGEIIPLIQQKYKKNTVSDLSTSEASNLIKFLMDEKGKQS
jgi:hypothetical protein